MGHVPSINTEEHVVRESRRLFYVGFTRAKVELHIILMLPNHTASVMSDDTEVISDR